MSESKHTGNPDGDRFTKLEGAEYDRVNDFLRDRTYLTAREWAVARVHQDFRTPTGTPTTLVGEKLPEIVPFMTDPYSPQDVYGARERFDEKVRKAANTFFYGALCGFYTDEELDELLYEAVETAKLMVETEGGTLDVEQEQEVEQKIATAMREVRDASQEVSSAELESGE